MTRLALTFLALAAAVDAVAAERLTPDSPEWGGSPARNNAPVTGALPSDWAVGAFDAKTGRWQSETAKNIRWVARLGNENYSPPVIAGGKVFCATNNASGYVARYPADVDLGCLLAFDLRSGEFLWQHSAEKLKAGHSVDWPEQGICSAPLVEGRRLWIVTNRAEVVCLDTEGFHDGENDGPYRSEPNTDKAESDILWTYDMMKELGTKQHYMACCSVTAAGDLLLVGTSNGVGSDDKTIPAPAAPSFIALDKNTGRLVWSDASPGANILDGQWASPAWAVLGGVPQAIFPGGDGWLYSFRAEPAAGNKPELLWKFDCNPKDAVWKDAELGDRNGIIATPVIHENLVYIATGRDPTSGEGQADLWCIDPTGRGDVSSELVVDAQGKPVPPRRYRAVDADAGEKVIRNENSAAVWHYRGHDANGDGKFQFEEAMHRSLAMVAIAGGLLVTGDNSGLVHCLDPKTGKVHWTYDTMSPIWGGPLLADGKIYLGDEQGELLIFELSDTMNLLATIDMGAKICSSPVAVGNTLYIATCDRLFAISEKAD